MIGLRIAHLVGSLNPSAAASCAINLIRWLQVNGHEALLLTTGGVREEECRNDGLDVHCYQENGFRLLTGGGRQLLNDLSEWRPDVLHVHRLASVPLGINLARKLGVPLIVGIHEPIEAEEAEPLANPVVDVIAVPNEALRAHLVGRLGLSRDTVTVMPYGFDLERFATDRPSQEVSTIGTIARFDVQTMGLRLLIDAVAALRSRHAGLKSLIVGGGPGRDELATQINDAGLGDAIEVLEASAQVAPLLSRMQIFVYPFVRDTHSITVIKAMASGCAVVAAAVGGIQEVVHDGETGLLIPPGDGDALALALGRLLGDPDLVCRLGRAAREFVSRSNDIETVGHIAEGFYKSVMRGEGAQAGAETARMYRRRSTS